MGGVIIAGQEFPIEIPIKTWHETGWDATIQACVRPQNPCEGTFPYGQKGAKFDRRYALRPTLRKYGMNPPLDAVKALLNQFIFHHDGCFDSAMCWEVLHNERGLSCHFLVDWDGTIFQTIDLAFMAYHAAEYNIPSIGVEMSNRGEAAKDQGYYSKKGKKRNITTCTINNSKILTFDFTDDQIKAMHALCGALTRLLPNIPIEYPQDQPGQPAHYTLKDAFSFKGYMGHYHCTERKWDPGPFDFKTFCEKLRGQRSFPLWTGKADPQPGQRPLVPSNASDLKDSVDALYAMNEQKSDGGYFPVGPWGENRLWHGGVHLATKDQAPIWAPFAGRIVAARMGKSSPYGSVNFVLVRHDMTVGVTTMRFFALYMHVNDELKEKDPKASPPWMGKDTWQKVLNRSKLQPKERAEIWDESVGVAMLDEPVEAGEIIARVGRAGPDNKPQIHFEIFSEDQVFEKFTGTHMVVHDGSGSGRFVEDDDIVSKIDTDPKDHKLSRRELVNFFTSPGERDQFRFIVSYNVSEWTAEPDWSEALKAAADFRDTKPDAIDEMVAEQITPGLWWTDVVARHCKLRVDGLVYHYNPIDFIGFINQQITEAALTAPPPPDPNDKTGVTGPAKDVTDDFGDKTGASAASIAQINEKDPFENLKLEDMISGYDSGGTP
jgi:N-acetylmuramoyl-L-alanine amidase